MGELTHKKIASEPMPLKKWMGTNVQIVKCHKNKTLWLVTLSIKCPLPV